MIKQTKPLTERHPGPEPAGRVCTADGCSTILSRWNPSERCAACSGGDWQTGDPTTRQLHDIQVARLEQRLAA